MSEKMSAQETAREAWLEGPEGKLCGREQAKAWALREVWQDEGKGSYGMLQFVAKRVRKSKNGKPNGPHPTVQSLAEFFNKVDADKDWYPGKHSDTPRGPKRVLVGGKKTGVVQAAKKLARDGKEVTYPAMVSACPNALINPSTGEPVDKKCVFTVFREELYDDPDNPEDTWDHRPRLSREALDPAQIEKRWNFAKYMSSLAYTTAWYFANLVWCDLCCSILPRTEMKAAEQARARKSGKFWGSKCSQEHSATLRGPKRVLKMKSSGTIRVWFVPVLSRGKLHLDLLPEDFPGETEAGAAIMVAKVRAALNVRFPNGSAPKILFTDRGNGFYDSNSGNITDGYCQALRDHRLKAFMGSNAAVQPGTLQEVMLHETAMAWVRDRLTKTVPKDPCSETVQAFGTRLKDVAAYINQHYDVDGLCRKLPERVAKLLEAKGDRLPH
jgi:hypothetical protein